ncbi:MAG: hypothetical protein GY862_39650 [Gammaproteobacteria bacterium]|nr:hypothetical protein [Gammaproteobacteria bacterium]
MEMNQLCCERVNIGLSALPCFGNSPRFTESHSRNKNPHLTHAMKHIENFLSELAARNADPTEWLAEGKCAPTDECKTKTIETVEYLNEKYNILPSHANSSVEEGIMLFYWNNLLKRSLEIEIYNDKSIAGVVNQHKKIVKCMDIESKDHLDELIKDYIKIGL